MTDKIIVIGIMFIIFVMCVMHMMRVDSMIDSVSCGPNGQGGAMCYPSARSAR